MTPPQHNYVISLTNAHSRRAHIEQEFGKQGISFSFFDAITPDSMEETAKSLGIDISQSPLTRGEIACALSHIALFHLAKSQNLNYICIFEDDVHLGENASQFLNLDYVDNTVDIVKIERNFETILTKLFPSQTYLGRKFYQLTAVNPGTGGYIVTKKGIDFLVKHIKSITDIEIDNLLFKTLLTQPDYQVWQMQPAICIQDCLLNPQNYTLGMMNREGGQWCSQAKAKKRSLLSKIIREIKRPLSQLYKKVFGKKSDFK